MNFFTPIPDMAARIRKWLWLSKRDPSEKRKIFRHSLVTAIVLDEKRRREILREARIGLESGDIETLMIDSGGFQVLKRDLYSLDELIRVNCELYQKYDFADYYVLPDGPPILKEPLADSKRKIENSIESGLKLFNMLPERIQRKCIPVFHLRDYEDIERQAEKYKHIIELSGMCCWASLRTTSGAAHRLTPLNIDLLTRLQKKLPSTKIHCLGIGSRQAMYCLNSMDIYSSDSTSPTKTAFGHEVIFGFEDVHSDDIKAIEKAKEITGHECSACFEPKELSSSWRARCIHNLITMEDIVNIFNKTTPEQFIEMFPNWYGRVQAKERQLSVF